MEYDLIIYVNLLLLKSDISNNTEIRPLLAGEKSAKCVAPVQRSIFHRFKKAKPGKNVTPLNIF